MINNPIDSRLFITLTNVLKDVDLHKDASNRYFAIPNNYGDDENNIKVVFLLHMHSNDMSVYLVYEPRQFHMKLDGYISKEDMQKLYQQLNERITNKKQKLLSDDDLDKISFRLKEKYNKSDVSKIEDINNFFAHNLLEVFNDIPGTKTHIGYVDASMLYVFLRSKNYDSLFDKPRQRGA